MRTDRPGPGAGPVEVIPARLPATGTGPWPVQRQHSEKQSGWRLLYLRLGRIGLGFLWCWLRITGRAAAGLASLTLGKRSTQCRGRAPLLFMNVSCLRLMDKR